jgi:hypothetical protein
MIQSLITTDFNRVIWRACDNGYFYDVGILKDLDDDGLFKFPHWIQCAAALPASTGINGQDYSADEEF